MIFIFNDFCRNYRPTTKEAPIRDHLPKDFRGTGIAGLSITVPLQLVWLASGTSSDIPAFLLQLIGGLAAIAAGIIALKWIRSRNKFGRTLGTVLGILLLIGIPVGTVLGVFVLWGLHSRDSKTWFAYQ